MYLQTDYNLRKYSLRHIKKHDILHHVIIYLTKNEPKSALLHFL